MSDSLRVVGDKLEDLADRMDDAADLLDNSVSGLSGHESDVGHGGVRDAVARFERHWGDGRTQVREQAQTLSQMLRDSVAAYDDAEAQLVSALEGHGGQAATSGVQVAV
ncbi:type VII secretion target [Cellulomonas sp. NPDC089187]|uniref:type VII secretion target n=1 Tax=Cellulomonas sp. NPDC089187 TaxID=3154970 RepID=UPI0034223CCC